MTPPEAVAALRMRIEALPGKQRAEYLAALQIAKQQPLPKIRERDLASLSVRVLRAEAMAGFLTR